MSFNINNYSTFSGVEHIRYLAYILNDNKLLKSIGIFYKLKHFLPHKVLKILFICISHSPQ